MTKPNYRRELEKIVGEEDVVTAGPTFAEYSYGGLFQPDALVFPADAGEVQTLVRLANEKGFPLIPVGAGSRLLTALLPFQQGVLVSLRRLQEFRELDAENLTVEVGAGVTNLQLNQALAAWRLFFPPDPENLALSTLGGQVATNAAGPKRLGYGTTRDYLLGLEFVTAQGELVRFGGKNLKNVAGYDVPRFLAGSRGALGIITSIIFKVKPLPETENLLVLSFDSLENALVFASSVREKVANLVALDYLDRAAAALIGREGETILLGLAGVKEAVAVETERSLDLARQWGATDHQVLSGPEEKDVLWERRRNLSRIWAERQGRPVFQAVLLVSPSEERLLLPKVARLLKATGSGSRQAKEPLSSADADGSAAIVAQLGTGTVRVLWPDQKGGGGSLPEWVPPLLALAEESGGLGWIADYPQLLATKVWAKRRGEGILTLARRLKESLDPKGILAPSSRWVVEASGGQS